MTNRRQPFIYYKCSLHTLTPNRWQSRTVFYFKVFRSRLPNKEFSIAKMAITERKLDVFNRHTGLRPIYVIFFKFLPISLQMKNNVDMWF